MKRANVDIILAICVSVLLLSGMVMVFSASAVRANLNYDGSITYFFTKQVIWGVLAFILMIAFSNNDYRNLRTRRILFFMVISSVVFLLGLFVFGTRINGALRWYRLGFMNFQPSEWTRLAMIVYFAFYLSTNAERLTNFVSGLLPVLAILLINVALIMLQPNLSTALLLLMITGSMLFLSRARLIHMVSLVAPVVALGLLVIGTKPYQQARVYSWLEAISEPLKSGYQIKQSLIALGRGGLFGAGVGQSKQKFLFLPDSHTDFIFSILGEELGFIGTTAVLGIFLVILYRGIRISQKAPDDFGKFLAIGLTLNIVLYAFINVAVVSMLLPATGLPMPFISYGGSNLLFLGISVGILLNISRQSSGAAAFDITDFKNQKSNGYRAALTVD